MITATDDIKRALLNVLPAVKSNLAGLLSSAGNAPTVTQRPGYTFIYDDQTKALTVRCQFGRAIYKTHIDTDAAVAIVLGLASITGRSAGRNRMVLGIQLGHR